MPRKLKPHTPAWFAAFQRINPLQTDLTRNLIKRAGHDNVCSTCGAEPQGDYLVLMIPYITLRLCQPCLEIYARTYGTQLAAADDNDASAAAR